MNRIMIDWRLILNVFIIDELMRIVISGFFYEDYIVVFVVGCWLEELEWSRWFILMD